MAKLNLLGIRKSKKHNHYTFPKKQEFFTVVRELLKELEFGDWNTFGRPLDKEFGETIYNEEEDIKKYMDRIYTFEKGEYCIEIIFGKDKVFLMIHMEKNRQQKLLRFLSKFIRM